MIPIKNQLPFLISKWKKIPETEKWLPPFSPSASMKKQLNCKILYYFPWLSLISLSVSSLSILSSLNQLYTSVRSRGGGMAEVTPLPPDQVGLRETSPHKAGGGGGGTDFWLFQLIIVGGEQLSKNNRDCQAENGYTASPRTAYKNLNLELSTPPPKKKSVKYNVRLKN